MIDYLKTIIEALKLSPKSRVTLSLFGILILAVRDKAYVWNMSWFYSNFAWVVILVTLFLLATIIGDIFNYCYIKYKTFRYEKDYDKYVLNLKGRKKEIVKTIFNGNHHTALMRINDTDLRELEARKIILKASNQYAIFPNEENLNNPPVYYLLQPRALELIQENLDRFK